MLVNKKLLCVPYKEPNEPTALIVAKLLEPLTAAVLSTVLLGQHLSAIQWVSGVLLVLSIWVLGKRAATKALQDSQRLPG